MKQAHTNGPWQAKHKRTLGDPMVPFLVYDIGKEGDPPLACVSNADVYMKPDELEANALLIAAAPEMLEALAEIQTLTKRNALPSDTRQGWEPVAAERMEKIAKLTRKAIARAKGGE